MTSLSAKHATIALVVCLATVLAPFRAAAQGPVVEGPGGSVEVYLQSSHAVPMPDVTAVVVLDPDVAAAELSDGVIRFTGLSRGDTVALLTIGGTTRAVVVHVVPRPVVLPPPTLQPNLERGYGLFGADTQVLHFAGQTEFLLVNQFSWSQQTGDHRVDVSLETNDATQTGTPGFNLRSGAVNYYTPRFEVNVLDFTQDVTGDLHAGGIPSYTISDNVALRGGRLALLRGRNRYTLFAGTTIPYYFLTLATTRAMAGFAFNHEYSKRLSLFGATSWVSAPHTPGGTRGSSVMQTAGFRFVPNARWTLDSTVGASNHGPYFRGDLGYNSGDLTAFASGLHSSPTFPLNQLQSLFSGTSQIRAGVAYGTIRRVSESLYYEHTVTDSGLLTINRAVSDYVSPAVSLRITPAEIANITYTFSRNNGGFNTGTTTGNRVSVALGSNFRHGMSNTFEIHFGSVQDPLGLQAQNEFFVSDGFSMPIKFGTLQLGFSHNRVDPSLVQKLTQQLGLLSPQLQQLFQQDPSSFIANDLPPDIRALLESQIPVSTSITGSAQLRLGPRLVVSPNVALTRSAEGTADPGWTEFFGYNLSYQLRPTLTLRSALSNVWTTAALGQPLQRSTILSFGFQKTFSGMPLAPAVFRRPRVIEGRVFRDEDVNGAYNAGEPGLEGVEVELDGGNTVRTDHDGRYRFVVSGDDHRVSLSVAQFSTPIRMTTPAEQVADLSNRRAASLDFGVVNFARLTGSVFNDLRFEGKRGIDTPPVGEIQMQLLQNGQPVRTIVVPASGTYEVNDIAPGDYDLAVDPGSLPANYAAALDHFPVRVAPVSTAVIDVPLRAMRSIAGHVYLKVYEDQRTPADTGQLELGAIPGAKQNKNSHRKVGQAMEEQHPAFRLVPLAGVQLTADHTIVKTDANGEFLMRNLPAGDLTVTLVPVKPVPSGVRVPSGPVHMPNEPIAVQNATIVITNPELVPYLTGETSK